MVNLVADDAKKILQSAIAENDSPMGNMIGNFLTNMNFLESNQLSMPLASLMGQRENSLNGMTLKQTETNLSAVISESLDGVLKAKAAFEPAIHRFSAQKKKKLQEEMDLDANENEPENETLDNDGDNTNKLKKKEKKEEKKEEKKVSKDTKFLSRNLQETPNNDNDTALPPITSNGSDSSSSSSDTVNGSSSLGGRGLPLPLNRGESVFPLVEDDTDLNKVSAHKLEASDLSVDGESVWRDNLDELEQDIKSALYVVTVAAQLMMSFVDSAYATRRSLVPFLGVDFTDQLMLVIVESVIKLSMNIDEMANADGVSEGAYFEVGEAIIDRFHDHLEVLSSEKIEDWINLLP